MAEVSEFRQHWRPLLATLLGMGSALSLNSFILSTFAPYLIAEFGWSRSQFALLGLAQILVSVAVPIAGRMTDVFGVRRVAAIGATTFPLFLVATAMMDGRIGTFLAILVAQNLICATTTATVYSRLVAETFSVRRGLALGLCGMSPALVAALGSPLISSFVADHGWRSGYLAVAVFSAVCAAITLALIPPRRPRATEPAQGPRALGVYRTIAAMPVFWLIVAATFVVNLPFTLAISQLKLVVLEQGLSDATAAWLVSAFAIGSIAGRIVSGAALDYLPAHLVTATNFALPFVGLLLLASPLDTTPVVATAIVLIGVSFGGEGDVLPYLVARYFPLDVFSTVFGLLIATIGVALTLGNLILAWSLQATNSFIPYLVVAAAGSLLGSLLFLLLGRERFRRAEA